MTLSVFLLFAALFALAYAVFNFFKVKNLEEGNELIVRPKLGKSYVFDAESEAFITKC